MEAKIHGLLLHDGRRPVPWLYDRKKERAGAVVFWREQYSRNGSDGTTVLYA